MQHSCSHENYIRNKTKIKYITLLTYKGTRKHVKNTGRHAYTRTEHIPAAITGNASSVEKQQ